MSVGARNVEVKSAQQQMVHIKLEQEYGAFGEFVQGLQNNINYPSTPGGSEGDFKKNIRNFCA